MARSDWEGSDCQVRVDTGYRILPTSGRPAPAIAESRRDVPRKCPVRAARSSMVNDLMQRMVAVLPYPSRIGSKPVISGVPKRSFN
jgi:hypothetical protein